MYQMRYVQGHIQAYEYRGNILFAADSQQEAREELMDYEESTP